MAKSNNNEFTFEELNASLKEVSPLGSAMDVSEFSEITEYISLGSRVLNLCMTGSVFGGIPNNRAVELCGPSGVGKTFIMLSALRNAQKMGYYAYWYDSENAVDRKMMDDFGIDTSKVYYEPCATVEQFRESITNLTENMIVAKRSGKKIPKIMVFLDSIGNLGTLKETNDALSGSQKEDMTRAKRLKSLFRIMMIRMAEVKIPFIYSNHVYKSQDFFSKFISSGGSGLEYGASIILLLTKSKLSNKDASDPESKLKSNESEQVGIIIKARPNKNRFAKSREVTAHLTYKGGLQEFVGLQPYVNFGWKKHGIDKGEIYDEVEFNKKSKKIQDACEEFEFETVDEKGKLVKVKRYFYEKKCTTIAVKSLGKHLTAKEFFSDEFFTEDMLRSIDKSTHHLFNYGVNEEMPDEELLDLDENTEIDLE